MAQKVSSKLQWRVNHLIGVVLIFVIFGAVQFVNFKNFYRTSLTSSNYLKLSDLTVNLVKNLPDPVKVTVFVAPQGEEAGGLFPDVMDLLEQYRYASPGKIEIKRVDPFVNFDEAQKVQRDFKLSTNENVVILEYRDRSKILKVSDMADVDNSARAYGGASRVVAFKGEQELTSGIQTLVLGKKAKIYFLVGHGEYDPKPAGPDGASYSILASYIERQSAEVIPLSLAEKQGVPEDADLLVIAGPRQRLTDGEINLLRAFLKRTGQPAPRMMLMLDPDTVSGLENFLDPYGVVFDNDLIMALPSGPGQSSLETKALASIYGQHPVINWALESKIQISFGSARSLSFRPEGAGQVIKLAQTPPSYWGEVELKGPNFAFDVSKDLTGPLTVAAAIDPSAVAGGEVDVEGPKIIVVGSANFLIDQKIRPSELDFFLNSMNWMLGKKDSLGIAPKQPQEFRISLPDGDKEILSAVVFLAVPGVILVVGLLVWLRRRK